MAKDPVCGMEVPESSGTPQAVHEGTTYYFCSGPCWARFVQSPERFVERGEPAVTTER